METLIFALIASHAYRQQEPVVAEPEEIQPFDLQALRIMDQLPLGPSTSAGAWGLRYPGLVMGKGGKNEVKESSLVCGASSQTPTW